MMPTTTTVRAIARYRRHALKRWACRAWDANRMFSATVRSGNRLVIWKLRPMMLLITLVTVVLLVAGPLVGLLSSTSSVTTAANPTTVERWWGSSRVRHGVVTTGSQVPGRRTAS